MIELGRKVKDEITGFTGVITGKSEFKIGDKVRFTDFLTRKPPVFSRGMNGQPSLVFSFDMC